MIRIKKSKTPEIFTKKGSPSVEEIMKAKDFFSKKANANGAFPFVFYSRYKDSYKNDLIKNFNYRCAYCETLVLDNSRGDIEHFRPKGELENSAGKKIRPGYYWLAADWKNLYLSCTLCNQDTTLEMFDPDNPNDVIKQKIGKMNKFALSDEEHRCNDHRKNVREEEPYRMLIDPCKDDPEAYLEYSEDGVIKPKKMNAKKVAKAEYSIATYGLQRLILVKKRSEKYKSITGKINYVEMFSDNVMQAYLSGQKARLENDKKYLDSEFNNLIEFLNVDKEVNEYIGLTRQLVYPFLNSYLEKLSDFLDTTASYYAEAKTYFLPQVEKINKALL